MSDKISKERMKSLKSLKYELQAEDINQVILILLNSWHIINQASKDGKKEDREK